MNQINQAILVRGSFSKSSIFCLVIFSSQSKNQDALYTMGLIQVDKKQLEQMQKDMKSRQTMYMAEAKARIAYQTALANIIQEVSDRCSDHRVVNDVVAMALQCEQEAKLELSAIPERK
jgi:FKBP-type peptidyl-prolyl cis-trans isomerase (trigger factor)